MTCDGGESIWNHVLGLFKVMHSLSHASQKPYQALDGFCGKNLSYTLFTGVLLLAITMDLITFVSNVFIPNSLYPKPWLQDFFQFPSNRSKDGGCGKASNMSMVKVGLNRNPPPKFLGSSPRSFSTWSIGICANNRRQMVVKNSHLRLEVYIFGS